MYEIEFRDNGGERQLERIGFALQDLRSFWPTVAQLFRSWMSRQFTTEGAFGGQGWAPLSPAYGIWKGQHYPTKGILQREGHLRRAATSPSRRATPTQLVLTIHSSTLGFHQQGGRNLPARPLLFPTLPAQAQVELDAAAENYVSDLLGRF